MTQPYTMPAEMLVAMQQNEHSVKRQRWHGSLHRGPMQITKLMQPPVPQGTTQKRRPDMHFYMNILNQMEMDMVVIHPIQFPILIELAGKVVNLFTTTIHPHINIT